MIERIERHLGETVHTLRLKNGMKVYILPKKEPYFTTYVELSVAYGALDLEFMVDDKRVLTPPGTAHFFEHQIFAMPYGDAFQKFSALGVDANAMTSYDRTSYVFSATDHVMDALTHLFDMIDTPYFRQENVDRERAIIAEEIKMYTDDINMEMQNELYLNTYHDHPIKYDIAGTLASIERISADTLKEIHRVFYQPSNRTVVIAGRIDLPAILSFFKAYENDHSVRAALPHPIYPKEKKCVVLAETNKHKPIGIDKIMVAIKMKPARATKEKRIVRDLSTSILTGMLLGSSSQAYEELFTKEWINERFYIQSTSEHRAELVTVYAETARVEPLKDYLIDLFRQPAERLIDEPTFERHKKGYIGLFVYALDDLETKARLYGKYAQKGIALFDVFRLLKGLTYDDLLAAFAAMQNGDTSVLIYKKA
ncbi:MAG: EF-P 5-aminopentanol modification-associated protein YfmH [Acholeplasmataceae bacterium]